MPQYYKLEIHHISVSGGDATVIAVRKKVNVEEPDHLVLIDAGKSEADLQIVLNYCSKYFSTNTFHSIILSHDHDDHRGALPASKMFNNITTTFFKGDALKSYFNLTKVKTPNSIQVNNKNKPPVIDLAGITFTCFCAGGVTPVEDESECKSENNFDDENDLSLAWVLEYKQSDKSFRYFTAGDLSGAQESGYKNVEGRLLDYLFDKKSGPLFDKKTTKNKTFDVIKATHHGSKFSQFGIDDEFCGRNKTSRFLQEFKPKKIIVPCNNSIPLPPYEFFIRAENYGVDEIFLVNEFYRSNNKQHAEKYLELDFDSWENKSNILQIKTKNEEDKDEVTGYTNMANKDKLPVAIVVVKEDCTCEVDKKREVDYDENTKAFKIDKEVLKEVPQKIPEVYWGEMDKILYKGFDKDDEKDKLKMGKIKALYNKDNDGDYIFDDNNPKLDAINFFNEFDEKTGFFSNLSGIGTTTRSNKKKKTENQLNKFLEREDDTPLNNKVVPGTKKRKR